ncbi:MAG: sulfatase-like hydrolase/transferase [Planctomycetota bacterium]
MHPLPAHDLPDGAVGRPAADPARVRGSPRRALPLALLLLAAAGCGDEGEPPAGASALLITLDTTRADALSCYGAPAGITPNLDRLAAEGVLFARAYAPAPLTLPSHLSMLTGLYPPRHGVRDNGHHVLAAEVDTLAEAAAAAGLQTAAFVSASVLHPSFGTGQGFATFDSPTDDDPRATVDYPARPAHDTVALAIAWLAARDRARGFFLWVHLWDPHAPYEAPARFRAPTPYLAEVACADDAVGILLGTLEEEELFDTTTVLVAGDHGEAFGEHGESSHGACCYDTTLRVPLILRQAGGRGGGRRDDRLASVVDVQPTLAAALGLPVSGLVDGRPLQQDGARSDPGLYFETYYGYFAYGWSPLCGWIDGAGKYLHGPRPLFFDLAADPGEEADLAGERGTELERYREAIRRLAGRPSHAPAADRAVEDGLREAIRSLGYGGGGDPTAPIAGPLDVGSGPSPLERLGEQREFARGRALLEEGRVAEAGAIFSRIVAENPRNFMGHDVLAHCLIQGRRWEEAIAHLQVVIDAGRASAETFGNLGGCLRQLGRADDALRAYLRALELNPRRKIALRNAVEILEARGRTAEAAPLRARYEEISGERLPDGR